MFTDPFVYVTYIRTTPQKLWNALIDPGFTRRYWVETYQESDWKVGSPWCIRTPSGTVADIGEVLEFRPHTRLSVSWLNKLVPAAEAEGYSRLTYELAEQGDTVRLTLTHEFAQPGSKLRSMVSGGWPPILASLKSLLETGESLEITRHWPKSIPVQ